MDAAEPGTDLGKHVAAQRTVWILHRGNGRASVAAPLSLQEPVELGDDADLTGAPVEIVVEAISRFLHDHRDWLAVWSTPNRFADFGLVTRRVHHLPGRPMSADEQRDVIRLGLDDALGEWVDGRLSDLFVLTGAPTNAE